jgi:leader peptidase (prepilin peptidase) / N-methyltransferase
MTAQNWFWSVTTFVLGICIGSFLNVVIWRLPRNGSLTKPQWSYCPACGHQLSALDLFPLLSYLLCGRRCRYCKQPISSRYFWVELITGVLFVVVYVRFKDQAANAIALTAFTALLVPMYCTDMELFVIPSQLNLLAFFVALARDIYGISVHEPGHELVWGWMPASLLGGAAGIGVFGTVRVLGWIWKRQETMGLGDVLLARAMGAMFVSFTPTSGSMLRLFPIWIILSCGSGAIIGVFMIAARQKKANLYPSAEESPESEGENAPEEESNLLMELGWIGYVLWFEDLLDYIREMAEHRKNQDEHKPTVDDDDWKPAATAIPFGPFMIIGFLATMLIGDALTAMYLAWAFPKSLAQPPA